MLVKSSVLIPKNVKFQLVNSQFYQKVYDFISFSGKFLLKNYWIFLKIINICIKFWILDLKLILPMILIISYKCTCPKVLSYTTYIKLILLSFMVFFRYSGLASIKDEYLSIWAKYYLKFFDAYKEHNISFWGVTTQNEPFDGLYNSSIPNNGFNSTKMVSNLIQI